MKIAKTVPAVVAGILTLALSGPAAAETVSPSLIAEVNSALAGFENADLQVQWQDGALILDGQADDAIIDKIVLEAARVDGVDTIVNKLYLS